jgi:hypothetical protein
MFILKQGKELADKRLKSKLGLMFAGLARAMMDRQHIKPTKVKLSFLENDDLIRALDARLDARTNTWVVD